MSFHSATGALRMLESSFYSSARVAKMLMSQTKPIACTSFVITESTVQEKARKDSIFRTSIQVHHMAIHRKQNERKRQGANRQSKIFHLILMPMCQL